MKRKIREHIDVLYLKSCKGKKRYRTIKEEKDGMKVLYVMIPESQLQEKCMAQTKKKTVRRLKKYETGQTAVLADSFAISCFQMKDILFEAKKQELLCHLDYILGKMQGNHMIVAIQENVLRCFNRQEFRTLLVALKDVYREITLLSPDDKMISDLVEYMYDEWGVVIHKPVEEALCDHFYDAALFLGYHKDICRIHFGRGYLLADPDTNLTDRFRQRVTLHKSVFHNILLSGLVYQISGKEISYAIAVNLAFQNPELYEKFQISFVDIYELEWYNRK